MSAFIFTEEYTFKWPVTVRMPVDGGGFAESEFTAEFALLDEAELVETATFETTSEAIAYEVDRMSKVLVGFTGIFTDEARETELQFTERNRDMLLGKRPVRIAITEAYSDAVMNGKLRSKN